VLIVNLFGSFDVRSHTDRPIALRSKKSRALLAYLSAHLGQPQLRDKLSALLWPEVADSQARQSLRQALSSLRRAIEPVERSALRIEGDTVTLEAKAVRADVATFTSLVARGTRDALEEAAGLYRGDLLDGLVIAAEPFEDWLLAERERLRELALEALASLLAKQAAGASAEPAIRTALRMLSIDPLQETVHRELMRLYVGQNRRPSALQQYQACVAVLAKELGVAPEPETRDLYQEILRQAPPTAAAEPANPLPPLSTRSPHAIREAPAQSLVGRGVELTRLTQALDEAWSGAPQLLVLEGEAGIGKSRLMEALADIAAARGGRVLVGRAYESEQILPFQPWIDALGAGHGLADEALLSRIGPPLRAELARLVPGIGDKATRPAAGADNPLWLFEGMRELLGLLAESEPLVVILEDVHWADEMTLRLLAFLARRLGSRPVLLAATARREELESAAILGRLLEELAHDRCVVRVDLAPLSRDATAALVRGLARAGSEQRGLSRTTDQVWSLSEGNPFVIVECMRSLIDSKAEHGVPALPRRVREVITARLQPLGERARSLLNVSAVVGREFSFALAQRAAGLDAADAAAGIEELVRFRVLDASGEEFEFAHDRIRRVVYESLLAPTRRALHGAVGGALESLHDDAPDAVLDQLAHHYTHAGDAGKAIAYLAKLAEATRQRHALTDAVRLLDQALAFVDQLPVPERDLKRVRLLLAKAFVFGSLGRYPEILPMLLPDLERVQGLGDPRLAIEYLFRLALTSAHLGRYRDAEDFAGRARRRAEEIGDSTLAGLACYALSIKAYWAGEPRAGMEHARESIRLLGLGGAGHWLGMAQMSLGLNGHLAGELSVALQAFAAATDMGRAVNGSQLQSHSGFCTALVYGDQSDWDAALATCDAALDIARSPVTQGTGTAVMGSLKLGAGQPGEAASLLADGIERLERFGFRSLASRFMSSLAEAHLASGDLASAGAWADRALAVASDDGSRWPIGLARRAQARIAAVAGDLGDAERRLSEAFAIFADVPAPLERAHTHVLAAELAARRGDGDAADHHLRDALRLYRELDVPRRHAAVEQLAHRLRLRLAPAAARSATVPC
jgi:DNA-binding SARP family transcriptional activator/tetratricopeptide (TPR) repeat protein